MSSPVNKKKRRYREDMDSHKKKDTNNKRQHRWYEDLDMDLVEWNMSSGFWKDLYNPFNISQRTWEAMYDLRKRRMNRFIIKKDTNYKRSAQPRKENRRWEEMDHDILVKIMERVLEMEKDSMPTLFYSFSICKSWLDALLDVYFPRGHYIFDLRPITALDTKFLAKAFIISMKLVLALRPTTYTHNYSKLIVGNQGMLRNYKLGVVKIRPTLISNMFQRLVPSLRELDLLAFDSYYGYRNKHEFGPYCKKLEAIFCPASTVPTFSRYSKYIHTLRLYGVINHGVARLIGTSFPLLKHLQIQSCVLSVNALPIILNGHPNLLTLDTQHCFLASEDRIRDFFFCWRHNSVPDAKLYPGVKALEWKLEEESFQGVKLHLQCQRRLCSKCSYLYH